MRQEMEGQTLEQGGDKQGQGYRGGASGLPARHGQRGCCNGSPAHAPRSTPAGGAGVSGRAGLGPKDTGLVADGGQIDQVAHA